MADTVSLPANRVGSEPGKDYALSGKIMLCAAVLLFAVIIFMAGLQLYAKWYVLRLRRRHLEHHRLQRRATRSQVITYIDSRLPAVDRGLDPAVLKSLPVFLHAPPSPTVECAVCISEFEEAETGRVLPKCGHAFHAECIDLWFGSHSTCPVCRSPVEPVEDSGVSESGSSDVSESGSSDVSSDAMRRKETGAAETESESGRVLSVKRILSAGRRSTGAAPEGTGEVDLESGPSESDRVRTPS